MSASATAGIADQDDARVELGLIVLPLSDRPADLGRVLFHTLHLVAIGLRQDPNVARPGGERVQQVAPVALKRRV